jgi:hypothetical protein
MKSIIAIESIKLGLSRPRFKNLRIADSMGSNPVRGKQLISSARNFTFIAKYWLVPLKNGYESAS